MNAESHKRRRLSPSERKKEILDAAYKLILESGISTLTMEKIAAQANSSKALLYNYYSNISVLLHALYVRELNNLQSQQLGALTEPHEFEEMVKLTNRFNREHRSDRQLLIKHLESDTRLRQVMTRTDQKNRRQIVEFLSEEILSLYDIPKEVASSAVRLILHYDEKQPLRGLDPEEQQDEIWGAVIVGAMQELEKRFGANQEDDNDRDS